MRFSSGGEAPLEGGDAAVDPAIDGSEKPEGLFISIVPAYNYG